MPSASCKKRNANTENTAARRKASVVTWKTRGHGAIVATAIMTATTTTITTKHR
jgi:hypothetical protein